MNVSTCEISSWVEPGRCVLTVAGEVDLSVSRRFEAAVHSALGTLTPDAELVLDLEGVSFLDSAGLHGLLRGSRSAAAAEVRFTMLPSLPVSRVLTMAGVEPGLLGVPGAGLGPAGT